MKNENYLVRFDNAASGRKGFVIVSARDTEHAKAIVSGEHPGTVIRFTDCETLPQKPEYSGWVFGGYED